MKKGVWLLFSCILTLAGCESLVTDIPEAKLPKVESKLVVHSFISPQSPRINVVVSESSPLFGNPKSIDGIISNATVRISDGQREAIIPYDTESHLYSIDKSKFKIAAGQTYYLTVTDGRRNVKSSCTVPLSTIPPKTYEMDTLVEDSYLFADTVLTLKMTWDDKAGEPNFYRMRASIDVEFNVPEGATMADLRERRVRNRFNFSWDDDFARNSLQSDANLDNTLFTSPTGRVVLPKPIVYHFQGGENYTSYPKSKIISLTMEVYNTDENYFRYHRSLDFSYNLDNPFVEPSLVFSNVEGGLGCFAAFNSGQLVYHP